jgi:hypothetical protein
MLNFNMCLHYGYFRDTLKVFRSSLILPYPQAHSKYVLHISFICISSLAQQPIAGQGHLILQVSNSHINTTVVKAFLDEGSTPSHRPLPDNTQHLKDTDIHAPGRIQIRNPSKQAPAGARLGPSGYRRRRCICL